MSSPWFRTSARLTVSQLQVGLLRGDERSKGYTSINVPLLPNDRIVASVFEHGAGWRLEIFKGGNRVRVEEYKGEARCRSKAKAWISDELKKMRPAYAGAIAAATAELRARGWELQS